MTTVMGDAESFGILKHSRQWSIRHLCFFRNPDFYFHKFYFVLSTTTLWPGLNLESSSHPGHEPSSFACATSPSSPSHMKCVISLSKSLLSFPVSLLLTRLIIGDQTTHHWHLHFRRLLTSVFRDASIATRFPSFILFFLSVVCWRAPPHDTARRFASCADALFVFSDLDFSGLEYARTAGIYHPFHTSDFFSTLRILDRVRSWVVSLVRCIAVAELFRWDFNDLSD